MKALIVNDDSISARYLLSTVKEIKKLEMELLVVVPTFEKSAASHSLTIREGLKLIKHKDIIEGVPTYSINGSPADCVKVAYHILNYDFDIVFSGVNDGLNMGYDINYSGTVAGAAEASFFNKKGMALSVERENIEAFCDNFISFYKKFSQTELFKKHLLFNVNFPQHSIGIKITKQGINPFGTVFEQESDDLFYARGKTLYNKDDNEEESDLVSYYNNYISVTPITIDRTDIKIYEQYKDLKA